MTEDKFPMTQARFLKVKTLKPCEPKTAHMILDKAHHIRYAN